MDEPLIYTTKGNVPESSLSFRHEWQDSPSALTYIEEYRDATGEVVKRSVAVYIKHGMLAESSINNVC